MIETRSAVRCREGRTLPGNEHVFVRDDLEREALDQLVARRRDDRDVVELDCVATEHTRALVSHRLRVEVLKNAEIHHRAVKKIKK